MPHQKQLAAERATPEVAALPSMEPSSPSVKEKEKETTETSLIEQGDQNQKDVVEGATESDLPEESKAKDAQQPLYTEELSNLKKEDKEGVIVMSGQRAFMDKSKEKPAAVMGIHDKGQDIGSGITTHETPLNYIQEVNPKQETVETSSKPGTELRAMSDIFSEHGSYFETSSKSLKEEFSQNRSYYELGTAGETKLHGETESVVQKLDKQHEREARTSPEKMSLGQRSLSLNITAGSSGGQTGIGENSKALPGRLCPISGSFDGSEVYPSVPSLESQHHFPPAVSITPTTTETSEDVLAMVGAPLPSDKQNSRFYHSGSFSETLDLAGALPLPSLERRELDYVRRKSMPTNVSALVGSSLVNLAVGDHTLRAAGENQFEELGYCVLNEYSGPLPSPADVPSPVVSPQEHFPSVESEIEEDLGATEVKSDQKVMQQQDHKGIIPENPPKTVYEKKNVPVKTTLILEKAVTSGVKPDRLRIPMTSSKDRLTDFRLESGLPGDLKIQAIPEVDNEKDPSRETSPIPPDSSFTFTLTEVGSKVPPTPTYSKSPNDTPSEITIEKARKGILAEVKAENNSEAERTDKKKLDEESEEGYDDPKIASSQSLKGTEEHDKKIRSELVAPTRLERIEKQETSITVEDSSTEKPLRGRKAQMQSQEVIQDKCLPKPHLSPTVIIIPQAQVEEEADEEDDIEIAEEPQEIMVEAGMPTTMDQTGESVNKEVAKEEQKKELARLMVVDRVMEDDPKSGAEDWSHSAQNSDDGEPATDSSHLSPWSDHGQPVEGARHEGMGEDRLADVAEINRDKWKKEQEVEDGVPDAAGEERKQETIGEKGEVDKDIEIGQEAGETFDVVCQTSQAASDETTMEVSVVDTDSGWMDSQGTQSSSHKIDV